jgi:O-succinylbenzoic acid--CoA ligase
MPLTDQSFTEANGHSMPNWLVRRADLMPNGLALLCGATRWSFADLDRQAQAMAQSLAAQGVGRGDRVALLAQNSPAFVALVHAVFRVGAVLTPLNTRLAVPELAWQLNDSGARLLMHDAHHAAVAQALAERNPQLVVTTSDSVATHPNVDSADSPTLDSALDLGAVHTIIYTSGTTGQPKGAMLTYGNHWWSAIGSALNLGHHADDRWLAVLPLFHVGGLSILMRSVIYGIPAVLHAAFDPAAVNRALDEDGVSIVSLVSVMLQRLLDDRGARPFPPMLRCVLLGGGPAPRPLLDACAQRGVPVVQTYGMTETASQLATLSPADALRKLGSAGKPLLPMELRIDRDGAAAQVGEVGEILVRGPTVMAGYANNPRATAQALRDGWLHTGDLGYLDSAGYLTVVDRRADLIISGGENVYPAEIEAVLLSHTGIAEAGVAGMPDERWGQVPWAWVTPQPGATLAATEVLAFCRERLAGYKTPRQIRIVTALPRNAAGKLVRHALRDLDAADSEL